MVAREGAAVHACRNNAPMCDVSKSAATTLQVSIISRSAQVGVGFPARPAHTNPITPGEFRTSERKNSTNPSRGEKGDVVAATIPSQYISLPSAPFIYFNLPNKRPTKALNFRGAAIALTTCEFGLLQHYYKVVGSENHFCHQTFLEGANTKYHNEYCRECGHGPGTMTRRLG
ncbi:hypothetical protein BJV78DRAFT_173442 [Lactifluus subvellereus]|nr:hypothetical protein BJV78DRAFT_173442 [Lactifluus subvellereus]